MRAVVVGVVVGVLVFAGLLVAFASGTGPAELLVWAGVAVLVGALVAKLAKREEPRARSAE